jgi:hypothetical protein
VTNAIVDDEIRQWVGAIRDKGAMVWLIVDACHSGTMMRAGGTNARDRGLPADTMIPSAALAAARANVGPSAIRGRSPSQAFELASGAADIAALYASDMTERTPELPMPDRNGPVHGLFTYTLTRILTEQAEPLTYRELVQRVIDRYRTEGFGPTPAFEGAGVDRGVLGGRAARDRTTFALDVRPRASRWALDAGSIHGLTVGSVLEVVPPGRGGSPAAAVGHVKVVDVHPTAASVEPVAYANVPAPSAPRVAAGSRARLKYHEFGALRLRVALQGAAAPAGGADTYTVVRPGGGPPPIERALAALPTLSHGLAERVDSRDADWYVRVTPDNRVILTPARDRDDIVARDGVASRGPAKRFDVGLLDEDDLQDRLADHMRRIARAANLARLSAYVDPEARLQLSVLKYESDEKRTAILAGQGQPIVRAEEQLQFVLRNTGTVPLDVTMLYVDADFGIHRLFPYEGEELDNRLEPARTRALDPRSITADPLGWESVVAIGVESTLRHQNFLSLAQPSLPEVRSASDGPPSPLRRLLESAMFGTRSSQADPADDRGRFAIAQTWFLVDEPPK